MYKHAAFGTKNPKTVFIFSDNDVVDEVFLEDIQNQLNGGMVPNIFPVDELNKIRDEVTFKKEYRRDGQTSDSSDVQNEWLYRRIKDNMHLSICMSPIGEKFRNYTRMYPALINNTTIDWFMPWPIEALTEVADKFIGMMEFDKADQKFKPGLSQLAAFLHFTAQKEAEDMKKELRRIFYVTPTNFVELLKGYDKIIKAKRNEIGANITKLDTGLTKLEKASEEVREMTQEAQIRGEESSIKAEEMAKMMSDISIKKEIVQKEQINIDNTTRIVKQEEEEASIIAASAQEQLDLAQPALQAA
jgi:dynein heavy chain